jgi:hypothetical protein
MVRNAIDAYNPDDATNDLEASELIGFSIYTPARSYQSHKKSQPGCGCRA